MARTLCKTNLRKALRKSWDGGTYEDVNDEWQACIRPAGRLLGVPAMCPYEAILWNWITEEEVSTSVGGCTSMTEYIEYAADCLLSRQEDRRRAA